MDAFRAASKRHYEGKTNRNDSSETPTSRPCTPEEVLFPPPSPPTVFTALSPPPSHYKRRKPDAFIYGVLPPPPPSPTVPRAVPQPELESRPRIQHPLPIIPPFSPRADATPGTSPHRPSPPRPSYLAIPSRSNRHHTPGGHHFHSESPTREIPLLIHASLNRRRPSLPICSIHPPLPPSPSLSSSCPSLTARMRNVIRRSGSLPHTKLAAEAEKAATQPVVAPKGKGLGGHSFRPFGFFRRGRGRDVM